MVKRITLAFDDGEFEQMKEYKKSLEGSPSWEDMMREGLKSLKDGDSDGN